MQQEQATGLWSKALVSLSSFMSNEWPHGLRQQAQVYFLKEKETLQILRRAEYGCTHLACEPWKSKVGESLYLRAVLVSYLANAD